MWHLKVILIESIDDVKFDIYSVVATEAFEDSKSLRAHTCLSSEYSPLGLR